MAQYVTGLFASKDAASKGFELLVETRFDPNAISVVKADEGNLDDVALDHKTGVATGLTAGAALGGGLGVLGVAFAAGGPVGVAIAASGPILAALQGAAAGAAAGGLLGALAGLAFWWDEPDLGEELKRGGVLVGTPAEGARAEEARLALKEAGAVRIYG